MIRTENLLKVMQEGKCGSSSTARCEFGAWNLFVILNFY